MNTEKIIYNNLSIRKIIYRLPINMSKIHKKRYINNCIEVYKNESKNFNLDLCQSLRNENFNLIKNYLYNK